MIVKPALRADWFIWEDPPFSWCQDNVELPGLQPCFVRGSMAVNFHVSHTPCMPGEVQVLVENIRLVDVVASTNPVLRSYQAADWSVLRTLRGALLAYEMRLGKTALACNLHEPNTGILVIAAPMAAREAWRDWVGRTFNFPLCALEGRTNVEPRPGYPAYFCHYDILGAHTGFFTQNPIGTLVLDEVHMLQARGTQRMSAVSVLAPKANKILALSGTPVWNKPKSLYTFLHILSPGAWGTQFEFRRRYCDAQPGAHGWTYGGISHADELQARLAQIMVRRTWADVAPELPPTTRILEPVELTGTQYTAIESSAMRAALARGTSNEAGYNATLRRKLAATKIKPAVALAQQAAADGHKVVLWVWHNEVGSQVMDAFPDKDSVFRLESSMSAQVRDWNVQAFRDHDGPAYLVASMGVGGVGLDLSCSDYAIFVELDWTPANVYQAEMRTFHMTRPHVVVYLYADSPTETALMDALDTKNGFAAALGLGSAEIMRKVW